MTALDLTEALFQAIEQRYATDAELLQLAGRLYVDFVPETESGSKPTYPLVIVSQGEEGGETEYSTSTSGAVPIAEAFAIRFDVAAGTRREASQIAWTIARVFGGDAANGAWTGSYPGLTINSCYRVGPPPVVQSAQGECSASVLFMVNASANVED